VAAELPVRRQTARRFVRSPSGREPA
jgi:hypothetical protein